MGQLIYKTHQGKEVEVTIGMIRRFWAKVDVKSSEECWAWKAGLNEKQYGVIHRGNTTLRAHRLSFLIRHGYLPEPPLVLRHTCDNACCVNPTHLVPGTIEENNRDMRARGRGFVPPPGMVYGDEHPFSKLTEEKVKEIHRRLTNGEKGGELAKEFGVGLPAISAIRHAKAWKHLGLAPLCHGNSKRNDRAGSASEA